MTSNIISFFIFYKIILFSVLGFGFLFEKIIYKKISYDQLGYTGLIGIFFLILYSYISHFFLPHGYTHNTIIVLVGLISFLYFFSKIKKKDWLLIFFVNFSILFVALLVFKTHDDFPYYHFPYSYYLTQHSMQIGIGQFNHGFRTPSSIFYLNSLLYLPGIKYFAFYIPTLLIMGFSNLILCSKIFLDLKNKNINYSFYLSLLFFAFINIFFYRIQEHGTDRSAQILIFILFLQITYLIDFKKDIKLRIDYILITLGIIISLKAFYVLYLIFFIPLLWIFYKKNFFYLIFDTFKNKIFYLFVFLILCVLLNYFLNTGCLIYPVYQTCLGSFDWSLGVSETIQMNNHYQLWSKAGLTPTFRIDEPKLYLQDFNWVSNWLNLYFFNKVSDFLIGLFFLSLISVLIFYKKKKIKIKLYKNIYLIYFTIFLLSFEWFFNHPALRYGGYVLIAIIILFPTSLILSKNNFAINELRKRTYIFILIVSVVFLSRNFMRIDKEIKQYNYQPIINSFYYLDKSHFRIEESMNNLISNKENCEKKLDICNEKLSSGIKKIAPRLYIFKTE